MTRRKIILALVALVAVASWLIWRFVLAPANPNDSSVVRVSGNIELIDVEMAFKIPGLVAERRVDEGDLVRQNDPRPLAKLDTSDLQAQRDMREAEWKAAQAALDELENGSREEEKKAAGAAAGKAKAALEGLKTGSLRRQIEVKRAEAAFKAAEFEMNRLAAELKRAQELRQLNIQAISKEQYENQQAAYNVALERCKEAGYQLNLTDEPARREQIQEAEQSLAQAEAQKKLVDDGAREEVRTQARWKVKQAENALRLAELNLKEYAVLRAPFDGVILAKHVERGEYVAPGTPVVTVGDMQHVWLRAYIEEQDLGRVKPGQRARVTTDSYQGGAYEGKVSFISQEAEFTPKNVQTPKERVKLVYRIKIDIDNPQMELKRGMPADAEILLDSPAAGVQVEAG
jgi:HlyD family secretion protein